MESFLGNYKIDDTLWVHAHFRNPSTGGSNEVAWAIAGDPEMYFDILVLDSSSDGVTKLYEDQPMNFWTDPDGEIDNFYIADSGIVLSTANGFAPGNTYAVVIKNSDSGVPAQYTRTFCIDSMKTVIDDTQYIYSTEVADGSVSSVPNSLMGRVYTVEKNQIENISPKLRRILGYLGENCMIDGYVHDDAGNISSCRMRIFDTVANLTAATPWSDTVNDSDPASSLESGEKARCTLSMTHALPRNLRTAYEAEISTDADDQAYDEASAL
jgi:hypothetical protein